MYKTYKTSSGSSAIIKENQDGTFTSFLFDPANTDYANFKKDLANGAELQDAEGNVIDGIAYLEELV
jgi:hypothetical protein